MVSYHVHEHLDTALHFFPEKYHRRCREQVGYKSIAGVPKNDRCYHKRVG